MPAFSQFSKDNLSTCDARLRLLFNEVVKHWDCRVLSGHREAEEQHQLFLEGKSQKDGYEKLSNHQALPSVAVDVAPYPIDWNDIQRFRAFGCFVLGVAAGLGIDITWGGDWDNDKDFTDQKFNDLPHFELRNS